MEYQNYRTEHDLRLVRRCREKDGKQIDLLQRPDGTMLICRVYDHPVPAYERLLGQSCDALPNIYSCRKLGSRVLVEEEFVDGVLLSDLLEDNLLDTQQASAVAAQICKALDVLHRNELVHRDVKPENIILTANGRVVLLDLDAACAQRQEGGRDTQLLGTVGYAAPEQFGFGRSDPRTDLFSLGVMMNVMLTGRHPSQTLAEGPLRPLIETCTQMNADKRFASAQALLHRLPKSGRMTRCPSCGFRTPGGGCLYCGKSSPKPRRRWPAAVGAGVAAALALWMLWKPAASPPAEPENTLPATEQEAVPPSKQETVPPQEPAILPSPEIAEYEPQNLVAGVCEAREPWEKQDIAAPFSYNGQTYYLAPAMWDPNGVQPHCNHHYSYCSGESLQDTYCIGFWTKDATGAMLEVSPAQRQELEAAFEELSLTVWAETTEQTELWSCEPASDCRYLATIGIRFDDSSAGWWLILAEGTIDGQTVQSGVPIEWELAEEHSFTPDLLAETDVLTQVAEWLEAQPTDRELMLNVLLPAGTYEGQLVIPEHLEEVRLIGALQEEGPATILEGGILGNSGNCEVQNVEFRGCGKNQKTWPDGTPNQALYGDGGGYYSNCIFSDFACAVSCTGRLRFGGNHSVFQNNQVAVQMNSANHAGGIFMIHQCTFLENDTALWFRQISPGLLPSYFELAECRFADNGTDIRNEVDSTFCFRNNQFLQNGREEPQLEILQGNVILEGTGD